MSLSVTRLSCPRLFSLSMRLSATRTLVPMDEQVQAGLIFMQASISVTEPLKLLTHSYKACGYLGKRDVWKPHPLPLCPAREETKSSPWSWVCPPNLPQMA